MNFSVTWIIAISLLVLGFFGIIFTSVFFTKPIDNEKFSFMRHFPFEARKHSEENQNFYNIACYLFTLMCFGPFLIYQDVSFEISYLNQTSIFIICALGLASIAFLFLNIFDATHTKAHVYLFGAFAVLTFFGSILIFFRGTIAFSNYLSFGKKEPIFIVTEILSGLVTIFILYICFNPKLSSWAKLEKSSDEATRYVRPKRFPLAYSEWAILLALFLNELIFFVQLLV